MAAHEACASARRKTRMVDENEPAASPGRDSGG